MTHHLKAPWSLLAGEQLRFQSEVDGLYYNAAFPTGVEKGTLIALKVTMVVPKPKDQVYVSMPARVFPGEKFAAILQAA